MLVICKSCFGDDGLENYIIFPLPSNCFTATAGGNRTLVWDLKDSQEKELNPPATLDNNLASKLDFI